MISRDNIIKQYSFESARLESLSNQRKIAVFFSGIQGLIMLLTFMAFTSLFLAISRIFLEFDSFVVYGVIAFVIVVLSIIIFTNFKKSLLKVVMNILPSIEMGLVGQYMISFGFMIVVFLGAWYISDFIFGGIEFFEGGFSFFGRWAFMILGIAGLALLGKIMGYPINRYKTTYRDSVSKWLIEKIDSKAIFNKSHTWPTNPSLFTSGDLSQTKSHPGIDMHDVKQVFAGHLHELHSCSFEHSLTIFSADSPIEICALKLRIKRVSKSSGKTKIEILDLFEGTLMKKTIQPSNILFRVSTLFDTPILLAQNVNPQKHTINNLTMEISGNTEFPQKDDISQLVSDVHSYWNTDVFSLVVNGALYLAIDQTDIFTDLALSANLFNDRHIEVPLNTICAFEASLT